MNHRNVLWRIRADTVGGTAIEYGLIAAIIVVGSIGVIGAVADENTLFWNNINDAFHNNTQLSNP